MLILFNKPFNVLSQFTDKQGRRTLAEFISVARDGQVCRTWMCQCRERRMRKSGPLEAGCR